MYFFTQTMGEQLALGYLARYAFEKQYTGLVNRDEKPTFGKCSSNISIHMKVCEELIMHFGGSLRRPDPWVFAFH